MTSPFKIAIAGLGTVGGGVVKALAARGDELSRRAGRDLEIIAVSARDKKKARDFTVSGWTDYTGAFTSGDIVGTIDGVWMTGTVKSQPDQSGKWGVAPIPKLVGVDGATNYSSEGGSSWYVLSSAPAKDAAIDFLKTVWAGDKDFYQNILTGQGAFSAWMPAVDGPAYASSDDFFGGQPVWKNFSDWQAKIPGIEYGLYTDEVNQAVLAQMPAIAQGGSVDDALKAINDQAQQQIQ